MIIRPHGKAVLCCLGEWPSGVDGRNQNRGCGRSAIRGHCQGSEATIGNLGIQIGIAPKNAPARENASVEPKFYALDLARSDIIHRAVRTDSPGVLRFGLESCEGERKVIIEKISLGANFIGFGLFHLEVVDHRRCRFATARCSSEEHTSELQSLMRISYAV